MSATLKVSGKKSGDVVVRIEDDSGNFAEVTMTPNQALRVTTDILAVLNEIK